MNQSELEIGFCSEKAHGWKSWTFGLLLALLLHFVLLQIDLPKFSPSDSLPPIQVHTIDPKKLETIRQQWKKKGLLLDHRHDLPTAQEASPDARYFSDRNIRVEKEQRARETNVIPRTPQGHTLPHPAEPPRKNQTSQKERSRSPSHSIHDLARLGLPMSTRPLQNRHPASEDPFSNSNARGADSPTNEPGGDQALADQNLPQGSENLLNTQESVFYSFYARLYESIGPLWQSLIRRTPYQHSIREGEYTTVVDVVFDKEGNLKAVRELRSSGIPEFDQAVQDAWNRVKRFPNPPKGLLDPQEEVHTGWTFTVMVNPGFRMNYLPPERNY